MLLTPLLIPSLWSVIVDDPASKSPPISHAGFSCVAQLPLQRRPGAGKAHVSPWERGLGSDPASATDQGGPGGTS